MSEFTPMMRQYLEIKENNKDAFLFYRMGDFYEMFFEDAKEASKLLDLVLTGREGGLEERVPMCGVPYHSAENYINRLIALGHKVAVCEQLEDPATAKGLVSRGVVRRITPGTQMDAGVLDEKKNNFIASVCFFPERAGFCAADISSGVIRATSLDDEGAGLSARTVDELCAYGPSEVVISGGGPEAAKLRDYLSKQGIFTDFSDAAPDVNECASRLDPRREGKRPIFDYPEAVCAAGRLFLYLEETAMCELSHMRETDFYLKAKFLELPAVSRRCLELTETMAGRSRKGSLLHVIDRTKTSMGGRLLRSWLEQPLYSLPEITRRQNAVAELFSDTVRRSRIREHLSEIYDLERLMGQIMYGTANAKTLVALAKTASVLPDLIGALDGVKSDELSQIAGDTDPLEDVRALVDAAIAEDPPFTVREGRMIRRGYSEELDRLVHISGNGRTMLSELEAREREKTGIKNLKVGYNRVFGYYVELPRSYSGEIPAEYLRKQTLSNCERYITPELKELESTILGADESINTLEYELFCSVRDSVKAQSQRIMRTAMAVARLDCCAGLAETAVEHNYTRPEVNLSGRIEIREGRHPVVEAMGLESVFVPNDTFLDREDNRLAIITGPNMAGKSTYMRQVALIVILAQIGAFVPASAARIGLVDKIFTRVGASDELSAGRSTFMVEMSETAAILRSATPESLIIFDEIGRGTSTFDGMAIARAVLEYAASTKTLGAKTMFATHYHELTRLEGEIDGIKNFSIAAKKRGDEIIFLRKILPTAADDSYGIEVGKLAGLPKKVISRAREVLALLESEKGMPPSAPRPAAAEGGAQFSLNDEGMRELLSRLAGQQADTMTPIEALNTLHSLSKEARELL